MMGPERLTVLRAWRAPALCSDWRELRLEKEEQG